MRVRTSTAGSASAASLALFAELHYVFTPVVSNEYVSQGDFLRLLSYGVLLAGVWRAIRFAEFGRAVAEERARVAREIHDGLAQYLFAISTHASMLDSETPPEGTVQRLKQAAAAAQQEARFAILALSSASGTASFDSALRRYVDILTADGELEVELEVDPELSLAPDEQIEVFRIIQEGLANVRKHAHARRADVRIGRSGTQRVVIVRDDGEGFARDDHEAGQGLKNLRSRAASIGGALALRSSPGPRHRSRSNAPRLESPAMKRETWIGWRPPVSSWRRWPFDHLDRDRGRRRRRDVRRPLGLPRHLCRRARVDGAALSLRRSKR